MLRQSASLHARPSARNGVVAQVVAEDLRYLRCWLRRPVSAVHALAGRAVRNTLRWVQPAPAALLSSSGFPFPKAAPGAARRGAASGAGPPQSSPSCGPAGLTPAMFGQLPLGRCRPRLPGVDS